MAQIKVMMQAQAATNPVNIEEKAARGIKFILTHALTALKTVRIKVK
jgi:hypothetical protein